VEVCERALLGRVFDACVNEVSLPRRAGLSRFASGMAMVVVKIWRRSAPVWSEEFKKRR
jgi:hypothetical protein